VTARLQRTAAKTYDVLKKSNDVLKIRKAKLVKKLRE
jgi:hypothetical protein